MKQIKPWVDNIDPGLYERQFIYDKGRSIRYYILRIYKTRTLIYDYDFDYYCLENMKYYSNIITTDYIKKNLRLLTQKEIIKLKLLTSFNEDFIYNEWENFRL